MPGTGSFFLLHEVANGATIAVKKFRARRFEQSLFSRQAITDDKT